MASLKPFRVTTKAILAIVKQDVQTDGSLQVCAGQEGGCEAAVHVMHQVFNAAEDNAVLLVDASNAFNSLHRLVTLHNTGILCPAFATILINTYRRDADLFVLGGHRIKSMEGTTQGDPLAMPIYAIGVKPQKSTYICTMSPTRHGMPMMPLLQQVYLPFVDGGTYFVPWVLGWAISSMPPKL